jgi:hypothetical protein
MALFPEKEQQITEHVDAPEIPPRIEKATGVIPVQTQLQPKQIVKDDHGQPLIESSQDQKVIIEVPASTEILESFTKGSTENSKTWFGAYWLRTIKKALRFGWQIITGRKGEINAG